MSFPPDSPRDSTSHHHQLRHGARTRSQTRSTSSPRIHVKTEQCTTKSEVPPPPLMKREKLLSPPGAGPLTRSKSTPQLAMAFPRQNSVSSQDGFSPRASHASDSRGSSHAASSLPAAGFHVSSHPLHSLPNPLMSTNSHDDDVSAPEHMSFSTTLGIGFTGARCCQDIVCRLSGLDFFQCVGHERNLGTFMSVR